MITLWETFEGRYKFAEKLWICPDDLSESHEFHIFRHELQDKDNQYYKN